MIYFGQQPTNQPTSQLVRQPASQAKYDPAPMTTEVGYRYPYHLDLHGAAVDLAGTEPIDRASPCPVVEGSPRI